MHDQSLVAGSDSMSSTNTMSMNTDPAFVGDSAMSSIDFAAIWSAVYRSRFWMIGIVLGCLIVGLVLTVLSTPIYRARATVQIDQEAAKIIGTEETDASASIQDSDRFLQTQLDVIRSRSLATTVAEDLSLFDNPSFFEAMGADPDTEANGVLNAEQAQREKVLEILKDNLGVNLPIDSRVVAVSFDSADPVLAARIANSFSENYIRNNLQRKFDTSSYAREFLKRQLDEAAARLSESERDALAYARRTRIIDTSNASGSDAGSAPRSLVTATLVQLNQAYASALARRIDAEEKWQSASGERVMSLPEVLNNLAIQRLLEERAKIEAEYQEQLERRKEDYPTVRQARARIKELDDQIAEIANGIRQGLRGEYRVALEQEQALQGQIATLKNETLDEQSQSVQLGILQRQTNNNRELYDLLLSRYNALNAEAGVQANNVAIIDRADTPAEPVSPNIPLNMALSLLAGLSLAGMFVFGREQLFDTIRTVEDVNRKLEVPALGAIPMTKGDDDVRTEALDSLSHVAEAFSSVRSTLMLASVHGLPRSLMFTSVQQSEGKSSSCFATAVALGRIGKKVLVIDLDLRRPNQHHMMNVKNALGMSDLMTQNAHLEQVLHHTEFNNVDFIASGGVAPNPAELLSGGLLGTLLREFEKQYDIVIIDSPPLLGLADAVEIGAAAESSLFIIESGRNQSSAVRSAMGRLAQGGAHILGALLTKFDARQAGYGYEYAYQYSYRNKS